MIVLSLLSTDVDGGVDGMSPTLKGSKACERTPADPATAHGPTLDELNLHGASIHLINREVLEELAMGHMDTQQEMARAAGESSAAGSGMDTQQEMARAAGESSAAGSGMEAAAAGSEAAVVAARFQFEPSSTTRAKHRKAPSKYTPLSKLAARADTKALLAAAQQRADERNDAIHQLERYAVQYEQQVQLKREAKAESKLAREQATQMATLLRSAAKELSCAHQRLQTFDDAAAKLAEAGMRDIPRLYAQGVTTGKIHPQSFFNTYNNDAVRNVLGCLLSRIGLCDPKGTRCDMAAWPLMWHRCSRWRHTHAACGTPLQQWLAQG